MSTASGSRKLIGLGGGVAVVLVLALIASMCGAPDDTAQTITSSRPTDTNTATGVTIGDNSVIGACSLVTKDIPANVVAVGNPCRVLRPISDRDKKYYFRDHPIDHAEIARDLEKIK